MKQRHIIVAILFPLLLAGLFCTREINPYESGEYARLIAVTTKSSLLTKPTVTCFSTETLTVMGLVREKIDSFSIGFRGVKNRSFVGDTVIRAPIAAGEYRIPFSGIDTGHGHVVIKTWIGGKKIESDSNDLSLSFNLTNPLLQASLAIEHNHPCTLSTPAVSDEAVQYNWRFKNTITGVEDLISSQSPIRTATISVKGSGTGELFVTDRMGHSSTIVPFTYTLNDTVGPTIAGINPGFHSDTLYTADRYPQLRFSCFDGAGIYDVSGAITYPGMTSRAVTPLDSLVKDPNIWLGAKRISELDLRKVVTLTITARDGTPRRNLSTKELVVVYDSLAGRNLITLVNPVAVLPLYQTTVTTFPLQFSITNNDSLPLSTLVRFNRQRLSDSAISPLASRMITTPLQLTGGVDTITITVRKQQDTTAILQQDTLIFQQSATALNNSPPRILFTRVNGTTGREIVVNNSFALCDAGWFDEDIDSVQINEKTVTSTGYYAQDSLALIKPVTLFITRIVDKQKNSKADTVWIRKNGLPRILGELNLPAVLQTATPWKESFYLGDPDNDSITATVEPTAQALAAGITQKSVDSIVTLTTTKEPQQRLFTFNTNYDASPLPRTIPMEIHLSDGKSDTTIPWRLTIRKKGAPVMYRLSYKPKTSTITFNADSGLIDMSRMRTSGTVDIAITADGLPLEKSNTVILSFSNGDKTSFNTSNYSALFSPIGKGKSDQMVVSVRDSKGEEMAIDTITVIYRYDFPVDINENSFGSGDSGIYTKDGKITQWNFSGKKPIVFSENTHMTDQNISHTPCLMFDSSIMTTMVRFDRSRNTNLLGDGLDFTDQGSGTSTPLTMVFVLRQRTFKDTAVQLLLANGYDGFAGFGIKNGRVGFFNDKDAVIADHQFFTDTNWHIITIKTNGINWDSRKIKFEVGVDSYVLCTTGEDTLTSTFNQPGYLLIGAGDKRLGVNPFNGDMAAVALWKKALSTEELKKVIRALASRYKLTGVYTGDQPGGNRGMEAVRMKMVKK